VYGQISDEIVECGNGKSFRCIYTTPKGVIDAKDPYPANERKFGWAKTTR
jgi:hypothetical protein